MAQLDRTPKPTVLHPSADRIRLQWAYPRSELLLRIGTSPLYTLKTVLDLTGGTPEPGTVLGVLSLIIWTLIFHVREVCDRCDEHRQ